MRPLHVLIALALLVPACTAGNEAPSDGALGDVPTVRIDGNELVLLEPDGTALTVAAVDDTEQLLHAVVRPGRRTPVTIVALTKAPDSYELRYLNLLDGTATDLYWFPWRMQVDDDAAEIADVPTLPVWAPDGSAVAWLEWDRLGTRLRTVGWIDHDSTSNPSDDQATYRVSEVPIGSQLVVWQQDSDGTPVLHARNEDAAWHIRIEDGVPVVAMRTDQ